MKGATMFAVLAAVSSLAGASALAGDSMSEKAAERLAGFEQTGEVTNCLSSARIRSMKAIDDSHFLVRVGGQYYLNTVSHRCHGASRAGNRIQYTNSTGSLCRNEIIRVVDNSTGMTVGSCGLGGFEKLKRVEDNADAAE